MNIHQMRARPATCLRSIKLINLTKPQLALAPPILSMNGIRGAKAAWRDNVECTPLYTGERSDNGVQALRRNYAKLCTEYSDASVVSNNRFTVWTFRSAELATAVWHMHGWSHVHGWSRCAAFRNASPQFRPIFAEDKLRLNTASNDVPDVTPGNVK